MIYFISKVTPTILLQIANQDRLWFNSLLLDESLLFWFHRQSKERCFERHPPSPPPPPLKISLRSSQTEAASIGQLWYRRVCWWIMFDEKYCEKKTSLGLARLDNRSQWILSVQLVQYMVIARPGLVYFCFFLHISSSHIHTETPDHTRLQQGL